MAKMAASPPSRYIRTLEVLRRLFKHYR